MDIYGSEKGLGASYRAISICDKEEVYGIGIVKVDDTKSYLIQQFSTDDFTDGTPALAYYVAVYTDSISLLNEEDVLIETTNFDNESKDNSVKKLKKENCRFGQLVIYPFIDGIKKIIISKMIC